MGHICANVKTCGVLKTAVAGKNKDDAPSLSCEHATEHSYTWMCKNTTCGRHGSSPSMCLEIPKEVVAETPKEVVAETPIVTEAPKDAVAETPKEVVAS
jgi:hypothetical protein